MIKYFEEQAEIEKFILEKSINKQNKNYICNFCPEKNSQKAKLLYCPKCFLLPTFEELTSFLDSLISSTPIPNDKKPYFIFILHPIYKDLLQDHYKNEKKLLGSILNFFHKDFKIIFRDCPPPIYRPVFNNIKEWIPFLLSFTAL